MKNCERDYLSLLKSFVQGGTPELSESPDFDAILKLAEINSTGGVVSSVLLSAPESVPDGRNSYLHSRVRRDVLVYLSRGEAAKNLLRRLGEAGIDCLTFKGFVVRNYYPMPELRSYGDIDFAIRSEDREKCHALMTEWGYECMTDYEPVYTYRKNAELYEIHTDVMTVNVSDKSDTRSYFRSIWEHIRPCESASGAHLWEFTPEYHFLYLLAHIAKHISGSGAGVRMYLDLAFFVRHCGGDMDWNQIAGELKKLRLDSFANVALTAAEVWFGVKNPLTNPGKSLSAEMMDDFLSFTLNGGTFGAHERDESVVYLKQQNRSGEESSRLKTVLAHAFPPLSGLKERYPYLQKHRWLLPAAWVQRLIDRRTEWGRYLDDTKKILTADPEEVRKLKRIYQAVGL